MTDMIPAFDNNDIPFAGRQLLFARLHQQILDPPHRHAIVFSGHKGTGKTSVLQQALRVFDENILLVFTSLSGTSFVDATALIQHLIDEINRLLSEQHFSLSRVPNIADAGDTPLLDWFRDEYLPEVFAVIRSPRRIVFLLDDAEGLLKFEHDFIVYLHDLLLAQSQFSIVLAISTTHEQQLVDLQPLVNPVAVERIQALTEEESAELIRQYAPGVDDTITKHIFTASGGHPQLLARFGQVLQTYRADHADKEAFALTGTAVYQLSQDDFRKQWLLLSRDERLVLTAIASLIYENPLHHVTAERIEAWLIETDYLLDIVAISAALRGLDYQSIVSHRQNEGIKLKAGLMQQWLLEQARLGDEEEQQERGQLPFRLIVIAVIVIGLIIMLLLVIPPQYIDNNAIATATLAE